MRNVDKYLFFLSLTVMITIVGYVFWGQNQEFTEDQLVSRMFKCPESFIDKSEQDRNLYQFLSYYREKFPTTTIEELMDIRYDFLVKNNCTETLQIWSENDREREEYWAEIERQAMIESVTKEGKSEIIR